MTFPKTKVALIGSGMISEVYLNNLKSFNAIELVGCSDIVPERAKHRAEQFGIRAMTNEEILSDPTIEYVVNTTYPLAHYDVAKSVLEAGKSVYTEKMVCENLDQIGELMTLAESKGLFFGGAPDTFLDGSSQLARQILDSGIVGTPMMAEAFLTRSYHHERYYTGTEKRFAFCRHGGIIFDMGAYYLSELVFLLGGIDMVSGFAQIHDPDRTYQNPNSPLYGDPMTVESWNNITGSLHFQNGTLGSFTMTSECGGNTNRFVIHCTEGKLVLGDPNNYESVIRVYNKKGEESVIRSPYGYTSGNRRGIGLLDAIYARRNGRPARCTGELNRHVLEATLGIVESSKTGNTYKMTTTCARPAPLPIGYTENEELVFAVEQ